MFGQKDKAHCASSAREAAWLDHNPQAHTTWPQNQVRGLGVICTLFRSQESDSRYT